MKDKYNIEMEDISSFALQQSKDFFFWEDISYQDLLEQVLKNLDDDISLALLLMEFLQW